MHRLMAYGWVVGILLLSGDVLAQRDTVLYLVGKVLMADNTPIPDSLRVELFCEGKVVRQSFPNMEGVFSFDLGSRRQTQTVTDASAVPSTGGLNEGFARDAWNPGGFHTVLGRVYLDDCVVRLGPTAEFTANDIKLGIRGLLDKPDVGELLVRRSSSLEGFLDAKVPPEARASFDDASQELSKKKPNRKAALKDLDEALKRYPDYVHALALRGQLELDSGEIEKARTDFARAEELDSRSIVALLGLSQLAIETQNWEEAASLSAQVLELDPALPRALLYEGLASFYLDRLAVSQAALEQLERLGQIDRFPIGLLHLGMTYAKAGQIPAAAERLERYLALGDSSPDRVAMIRRQLADWRNRGLLAESH